MTDEEMMALIMGGREVGGPEASPQEICCMLLTYGKGANLEERQIHRHDWDKCRRPNWNFMDYKFRVIKGPQFLRLAEKLSEIGTWVEVGEGFAGSRMFMEVKP